MCQLHKFNNVKVWALVSTKLREVDTFQQMQCVVAVQLSVYMSKL